MTAYTDTWYQCPSSTAAVSACTQVQQTVGQATQGDESYVLGPTDVGKYIVATEMATESDMSTMTVTTTTVGPIASTAPELMTGSAPTITGTLVAGETLTGTSGSWTNTPTGYSYAWRCSGCGNPVTDTYTNPPTSPLPTTDAYVIPTAAIGYVVNLTVTASNADYPSGTASPQANTGAVVVAPAATATPTLMSTPVQGQAETAKPAVWNFGTPGAGPTYQWYRCPNDPGNSASTAGCTAVGTGNASYTPTADDVGQWLEVTATAAVAAGDPNVTSPASPAVRVQPPAPTNSAAPGISGTAQLGRPLTEVPGHWSTTSAFPTTIAVQWMRCASDGSACAQVATGSTYTPSPADIGGTLQVDETATNATGTSGPVYSALSAAVLDAAGTVPAPALSSAAPSVSGTPALGATLHAIAANFSGNPGTVTDAWQRCSGGACTTIPGATDTSYAVSAADVGYGLRFAQTATNSAGSASATSGTTAAVTAASQTTLQASTGVAPAGTTVTMIASVTTAAAANAGTVTFTAGGTPIAGCDAIPLGATPSAPTVCHASFSTSAQTLIATFAPAAGTFVQASSSPSVALTTTAVATKLTLRVGSTAALGRSLTLKARLQPSASGSLAATGTVAFLDGTHPIAGCGGRSLDKGRATCKVTWHGLASHTIVARYGGDTDFAGSSTRVHHVTVTPLAPTGVVNAFLSWTFAYGPKGTRVRSLSLSGLKPKIRLAIDCSGHGCPFAHHNATIARHSPASLQLTGLFGHTPLQPGAALTIRLSHPGWVGKYYRFSFRHGAKPTLRESCLAVDSTRPSVGCTAS